MRTIRGYITAGGSAASVVKFDFEVEDDATQEEIEKACWEAGCNYIDCWWEEGEKNDEL